jgi:hypothetical protein
MVLRAHHRQVLLDLVATVRNAICSAFEAQHCQACQSFAEATVVRLGRAARRLPGARSRLSMKVSCERLARRRLDSITASISNPCPLPQVSTQKGLARRGTGCASSHFYRQSHLVRQVDPFTTTYEGCDYATREASYEAGAHNQGLRRNRTGRGWIGLFAGGERIRIHDTHC